MERGPISDPRLQQPPSWCLSPKLTSAGEMAAPYSSRPCQELPSHRVTLCGWGRWGRLMPMLSPVVLWASFLFPSWWSPWEGGVTKPPAPSPTSVAFCLQGQRLGISPPESTNHLFQRLAISLWWGNAALWIRRQPALPAEEDGIIWLNFLFCYILILSPIAYPVGS